MLNPIFASAGIFLFVFGASIASGQPQSNSPNGDPIGTSGSATDDPVSRSSLRPRTRATTIIDVKNFGAIGDGASHPLIGNFNSLASARSVCPEASALTDEMDWCALQAAIDAQKRNGGNFGGKIRLSAGNYRLNETIVANDTSLLLEGDGELQTTLSWTVPDRDGIHFGLNNSSTAGSLQLRDMTLINTGHGGTAVTAQFGLPYPTLNLEHVQFGTSSAYWQQAVVVAHGSEMVWRDVRAIGNLSHSTAAYSFSAEAPGPPGHFMLKFQDMYIAKYQTGFRFSMKSYPGIQGVFFDRVIQIFGNDFVDIVNTSRKLMPEWVFANCQTQIDGWFLNAGKNIGDIVARGNLMLVGHGGLASPPRVGGGFNLERDSGTIISGNQMHVIKPIETKKVIFLRSDGENGIVSDNNISNHYSKEGVEATGIVLKQGSRDWLIHDNFFGGGVAVPISDSGVNNRGSR